MKKFIKNVAIIAVLLANVVGIEATISRFARAVKPVTKSIYQRTNRKVTKKDIKRLNEESKNTKTSSVVSLFNGDIYVHDKLEELRDAAKEDTISPDELCEQVNDFGIACANQNYGALNLPDMDQHTVLYYMLINKSHKPEYRPIIRLLQEHGAKLNNRDKFIMSENNKPDLLKAQLNLSLAADAKTTLKEYRRFMSNNTPSKINSKMANFTMSGLQAEQRRTKVEEVSKAYNLVAEDLLSKAAQERTQAKRDARMPE